MSGAIQTISKGTKAWATTVKIHPATTASLSYDDLTTGKSCQYSKSWWTFYRSHWQCKDCGAVGSTKCRHLHRRNTCPSFSRRNWEDPPRFQSQYDPNSFEQSRTMNLRKYSYQSQPLCTVASCFDLSRCSDSVLTVYVNASGPHNLVDYAVKKLATSNRTRVERVDRFQDACLVLVTKDTYQTWDDMTGASSWMDGTNNLLWRMSQFRFLTKDGRSVTVDNPFSLFHVGHAAVASESLTSAYLRPNFDMPLNLNRRWGRRVKTVDIYRPRKWLVSFRGSIQNTAHPYYQHRWLAAEYWEDAPDIVVDTQCIQKLQKRDGGTIKHIVAPYRLPVSSYADMMWNSTFGFAPGGSGVGSFRFGEILSTGGIPIVTADFVPPLYPEVDWSGCLVRISEARIIDLPRILREYTPDQVRKRQGNCWHLLQTVIGDKEERDGTWHHNEGTLFTKAMEIWAIRVSTILRTTGTPLNQ